MKEAFLLFRQPQMSGGLFSHGRNSSTVTVTHWNESVVFQIPKLFNCRNPDPPLAVLKQRIWCSPGCSRILSASDAVHHRDVAVLPRVQAVVGRDPDTTVFGPNDRHAFGTGQSLLG